MCVIVQVGIVQLQMSVCVSDLHGARHEFEVTEEALNTYQHWGVEGEWFAMSAIIKYGCHKVPHICVHVAAATCCSTAQCCRLLYRPLHVGPTLWHVDVLLSDGLD